MLESTRIRHKPVDRVAHATFAEPIRRLPPEQR